MGWSFQGSDSPEIVRMVESISLRAGDTSGALESHLTQSNDEGSEARLGASHSQNEHDEEEHEKSDASDGQGGEKTASNSGGDESSSGVAASESPSKSDKPNSDGEGEENKGEKRDEQSETRDEKPEPLEEDKPPVSSAETEKQEDDQNGNQAVEPLGKGSEEKSASEPAAKEANEAPIPDDKEAGTQHEKNGASAQEETDAPVPKTSEGLEASPPASAKENETAEEEKKALDNNIHHGMHSHHSNHNHHVHHHHHQGPEAGHHHHHSSASAGAVGLGHDHVHAAARRHRDERQEVVEDDNEELDDVIDIRHYGKCKKSPFCSGNRIVRQKLFFCKVIEKLKLYRPECRLIPSDPSCNKATYTHSGETVLEEVHRCFCLMEHFIRVIRPEKHLPGSRKSFNSPLYRTRQTCANPSQAPQLQP